MISLVDVRTGECVEIKNEVILYHWLYGPLKILESDDGLITVTIIYKKGTVKATSQIFEKMLSSLEQKKFLLSSLGKWIFLTDEEILESGFIYKPLIHKVYPIIKEKKILENDLKDVSKYLDKTNQSILKIGESIKTKKEIINQSESNIVVNNDLVASFIAELNLLDPEKKKDYSSEIENSIQEIQEQITKIKDLNNELLQIVEDEKNEIDILNNQLPKLNKEKIKYESEISELKKQIKSKQNEIDELI